MIFQHARFQIWNQNQHPFVHNLSDFGYTNSASPGVSNVESALNYIFAVLYPQSKTAVANPAALPLVGNTINDMRVVNDDGDGKAASYRWEQREGEASPSWHKIYDMDWGSDSILQQFFLKTQDIYVHRLGFDDLDAAGVAIVGTFAGQRIYGGRSASTNLTLSANSGDGVGAQTGYVQFTDQVRPTSNNALDLGTSSEKFRTGYFGTSVLTGTLTASSGSITDTSGAISFDNENLSTTGSMNVGSLVSSGAGSFGTLTLNSGSITDTSGAISFANENLSTTGTITAQTFITGTLSITDGLITDTDGAISFDNENLSTTGTLSAGNTTVSRLDADNIRLDGNSISITNANGSLNLAANGSGVIDMQSAMTTLGQTVTGTLSVTGQLNADNLRIDGNTLSSTNVDGDIALSPNGTGLVSVSSKISPTADGTLDLGATASRFNDVFFDGSLRDGTTSITQATLQSLRDINVGVGVGYTIFWDGSKWVSSAPDSEIDHGTLSGLADDDHTQYALLAGRSGGQTLNGSTLASEHLNLDSTAHATKGFIKVKSDVVAFTDASYSGGWSGTDLGDTSNRFRHVYTAGEFFGLRLENVGALPSPSTQNVGRLVFLTTDSDVYTDTGTTLKRLNYNRFQEDTVWNGSDTTKNVTVSDVDARSAIWQLKDNTNDFEVIYASIKATSATNVLITVTTPLAAGSYRLIGLE